MYLIFLLVIRGSEIDNTGDVLEIEIENGPLENGLIANGFLENGDVLEIEIDDSADVLESEIESEIENGFLENGLIANGFLEDGLFANENGFLED